MISTSAAAIASNFSVVGEKPEMADPRVVGHRQDGLADEHELKPARHRARVALEVLEQLLAALVLVDAAHVDRKRAGDAELLPEPLGLGTRGNVRADADDDAGQIAGTGDVLDHGALFERVEHQRAHAPEDRRKDRQPDGRVPLGRRDQHRLEATARTPWNAW